MKGSTSVFASRLKSARQAKGLSQEELGVRAGIEEFSARQRIYQYENGVHTPHFEMAEKIADVLGIPTALLYSRRDDEADILCLFHSMSEDSKKRLLTLAKTK